ncbi:glucosamine-6-phosphate deaminase [Salidesulfovibrio onnuriiensis]|uniref:glucosamine-6-phosphate deaminase n=1 Tax=Salidesulfovibrio onnuriiensis TaxID=2583823 RepID=UPI0011C764E1|nr:glucosamine-6-phosphate deaminase [Salidesulfovibrio onnuriiensis]
MRLIPLNDNVGWWAARYVARRIRLFEPGPERPFVLGLPTGGTPLPMYGELVRMHREEGLSLKHVVTFNMDEYVGLPADHPESYRSYMHMNFFDHVDLRPENINLLNGNAPDLAAECRRYEEKMASYGGVNLWVGGVGSDGHIAFNEPTSSLSSRTRDKDLTLETRRANARFFGGQVENVPELALTVGVGTLLDAEEMLVLATGMSKALAVRHAVEEGINHLWTVSAMQMHRRAVLVCDRDAVRELRVKTLRYFQQIEAENIKDPK